MSHPDLKVLRDALAATPTSTVLRMALIHRLVELDETSEALACGLSLDPGEDLKPGDRDFLADLFLSNGLAEVAARWRDTSAQPAPEQRPEPAARQEDEDDGQNAADQEGVVMRLVGGGDVGGSDTRDNVVPLYRDEAPDARLTFADVGGLADVKKDIHRRIILPFAEPSLMVRFRKRAGGGVLVYGPPGCGKTLLARATAGECGANFFAVHLSEVLDPFIGGSEQRLSGVFETARASTPAILFFDEIDALGTKRSVTTSSHIAQLSSHFLAELDGVDSSNKGILILAATNAPWSMDPAFLRPGRFDRTFFVPPPDRPAREEILRLELTDRLAESAIDHSALAKATSGRSGADLRAIVERAADTAIEATLESGQEVPISQRMLLNAVGETTSTVAEWLSTARNHATYSNQGQRYDEILAFLERHGKRR